MKTLTIYILKKCFLNTFLLLFAFLIIYSIVQGIQEIGDIGKGNYNLTAALIYLAGLLPGYIYLLFPLSVLIGVMTTMLGLVKNSEYAIIRTSGVSLRSITYTLGIFGLMFAIFTFTIGELIAPGASHFAKNYKLNKTQQRVSTTLSSGIWSKDGEHKVINIKKINQNNPELIGDITIFSYTDNQELQEYLVADHGSYQAQTKSWLLESVTKYSYLENRIEIESLNQFTWQSSIEPSYFSVLIIAPEDMPAFGLMKYIVHLRENHQSTNRPKIAMWSKLLYPISCISMALIAIGFIPNNGRNINLSGKLFIGILIGIGFFFTNKLIGFMATLYSWNPILSAVLPTAILFSIGIFIVFKKDS